MNDPPVPGARYKGTTRRHPREVIVTRVGALKVEFTYVKGSERGRPLTVPIAVFRRTYTPSKEHR